MGRSLEQLGRNCRPISPDAAHFGRGGAAVRADVKMLFHAHRDVLIKKLKTSAASS
jgi:hypothetical protein